MRHTACVLVLQAIPGQPGMVAFYPGFAPGAFTPVYTTAPGFGQLLPAQQQLAAQLHQQQLQQQQQLMQQQMAMIQRQQTMQAQQVGSGAGPFAPLRRGTVHQAS